MKKFTIKFIAAAAAILCAFTISGCQNKYSDKIQLAEGYLNNELAMDCTVTDCRFQQYDYGEHGGMFIYTFECKGSDGSEFRAIYQSYSDLTAETAAKLVIHNRE